MNKTNIQNAIKRLRELGELEQNACISECRGHLLLVEGIIKILRWEQEKALRYIEIKLDQKFNNEIAK